MLLSNAVAPLGAAIMCSAYAFGGLTNRVAQKFKRRWASLAAGASVAYVFVEIIPELEVQKRSLIKSLGEELFSDKRIYVFALLGFVLFAALEHLKERLRLSGAERGSRQWPDAYSFAHLAVLAAYNVVIGYLLTDRAYSDHGGEEWSLWAYVFAMVLHIWILDHTLAEAHGGFYIHWGRIWLAASLLTGWALGMTEQLSESTFSRLFAVVAGGVVFTSASEELPTDNALRFLWFVSGAAFYGLVLLLV